VDHERVCPAVTAAQMREVDRAMIEDFHIGLVQMMENAGAGLARLAVEAYTPSRVVVLAGRGGNGGGGLVAARHLANRGLVVHVVLAEPAAQLTPVPAHQLEILCRMGVPVTTVSPAGPAAAALDQVGEVDLILDALIGYSLLGDPTEPTAGLIRWANAHPAPVLSLDTPSGLDVTTGVAAHPCLLADATLTLALPKTGLLRTREVGRLHLADISVPPLLYQRMGMTVSDPFGAAPVVPLDLHGEVI
jgi:NAD(P)H-hydrate epimerase